MATKTSRSQRPKSGQRRTEKPVDSEIRRAAKRPDTVPSPPPPMQPEPASPTMFREGCGAENFRNAISRLLTGGLYVSRGIKGEAPDVLGGVGPHAALLHLVEVQTRILATAVAHYDSPIDGHGFEFQDWAIDCDQITRADLVTSLNGLSAFAREGRDLIDRLLCYGDFRFSEERKHPGRSFHRAEDESDTAGGES